jgi:hypothetical protein
MELKRSFEVGIRGKIWSDHCSLKEIYVPHGRILSTSANLTFYYASDLTDRDIEEVLFNDIEN